jgi:hypothetical protein
VKLPYSVDVMSEEAAVVALEGRAIIEARLTELVSERDRLFASLIETEGVTPFPSRANFVSFRIDDARAKEVFRALHAGGILIRDISSYPQMKNCLRVSVGKPDENEQFIRRLRNILAASTEGRARDARPYEEAASTHGSTGKTDLASDSGLRTSDPSLSTQHSAPSTDDRRLS